LRHKHTASETRVGLSKPIVESRRADSNRPPTLFTSVRSRVAGRCGGLQTPHR
jgi:hypothetical protein